MFLFLFANHFTMLPFKPGMLILQVKIYQNDIHVFLKFKIYFVIHICIFYLIFCLFFLVSLVPAVLSLLFEKAIAVVSA